MEPGKDYIMNKRVLLRILGFMAGVVLLVNCVGCGSEPKPEKSNTSNRIEVETIEIETIEVENNIVYWPD